jgi:hypothetical protein
MLLLRAPSGASCARRYMLTLFVLLVAVCLAADMKALHPDDKLCCCFLKTSSLANTLTANYVACWLQT